MNGIRKAELLGKLLDSTCVVASGLSDGNVLAWDNASQTFKPGAGGGSAPTAASILASLLTVDGSGSGLDADLLDGINLDATAGTAASTIPQKDSSNDLYLRGFRTTGASGFLALHERNNNSNYWINWSSAGVWHLDGPSVADRMTIDNATGIFAFLGSGTFTKTALATATADGVVVTNTTAATSGATVQVSPAVHWTGSRWTGSVANAVEFRSYTKPTGGAGTDHGMLNFEYQIAGGGWVECGAFWKRSDAASRIRAHGGSSGFQIAVDSTSGNTYEWDVTASGGKINYDAAHFNPKHSFQCGGTENVLIESGKMTFKDTFDVVVGTSVGTKIETATGQLLGFWGATPVVQQVLATGGGKTVDNVITFLQTLGLCKQS